MELAKKIFKYVFILLGVCIAGAVLLVAVMMFAHTKIFGIFYVNEKAVQNIAIATTGESQLIANDGTIETINIKTNRFSPDIEYYTDETESTILVRLNYTLQGFGKGEIEKVAFAQSEPTQVFDQDNRVLTIETKEPDGLFFTKKCQLTVFLPASMKVNNVNIEVDKANGVSLNQNAVIKVGDDYKIRQMNLKTLSVKQTSMNYKGLTLGKLASWQKKNVNEQVIASGENISLTTEDLSLDTVAGRVYVNCKVTNNVQIKSEMGSFIFKKLINSNNVVYSDSVSGNVSISGNCPYVEFGTISNQNIDDAKAGRAVSVAGQFSIGGQLSVDCNATVKVSGTIYGAVGLDKNGATLIANNIAGDYMTATSGTGGITVVGTVSGLVRIGTDTDVDVTVNDVFINICNADIEIKANNKPVTINSLSSSSLRNCKIESNRGNVAVKSVDSNYTVDILVKDGSATVNFTGTSICGQNKIKATGAGNIYVTFKDNQRFELVATAKSKNKIKINLISFDTTDGELEPLTNEGGYVYYDVQINGHSGDAKKVELTVVNGSINGSYAE